MTDGDTRTAHTQLVSLRVPHELWADIVAKAEAQGRSKTAEMISRLERGGRKVDPRSAPKPSVATEPKKHLQSKTKLAEREKEEEAAIVEALKPCTHEQVKVQTYGVFCAACGEKVR